MSLSKKIAGNTAAQVAGRFIGTVFGIFTIGVMTRELGRDGYGAFTTAMSFLQFFGILVDFGLTLTMAKMIAEAGSKEEEDRIASNIFTLRLTTAVVFFAIAPILALFFPYSQDIKTGIAIAAFSFFFMALSGALVGVFQKHLATHLAAITEVTGRGVLLALTLIAAWMHVGLFGFMIALVAGNVVQFGLTLWFVRSFVRLRLAFDMQIWKRITAQSWPIGVSIAFNLIYLKSDVIILSFSRTQEEIGIYGAAYKVLDVVTVVPMIFMGLVMPLLAASWTGGRHDEFMRRMRKSFDTLALAAIPLAIGTIPVAADLMTLVAGDDFAASGPILAILMFACSAVFLSALFGHTVVAIGMQRPMIWAYALDAIVSLALYIYLVPSTGPIGAAWITVFSEAFIMVLCAVAVCVKTRSLPSFTMAALALVASGCMYGVLTTLAPVHVLLRIPIGAAAYGAVMILLSPSLRQDALAQLRALRNRGTAAPAV